MAYNEDIIKHYGFQVIAVSASEFSPSFAYTVGLVDQCCPELIIVGLDPITAHTLLTSTANSYRSEEMVDDLSLDIANLPIKLGPVSKDNIQIWMCQAFYRADEHDILHVLNAKQLIWTDKEGVYPNEDGFDESMREAAVLLA